MFNGNIIDDCKYIEKVLEKVDYYSGTERRSGQFKTAKTTKGNGSMLYGYTWKGFLKKDKITGENITRTPSKYKGLYHTKVKDLNPHLEELFMSFSQQYFPDFNWTQVQMNKNYLCPPHFDSKNVGESILISFGDYTGGKTCIETEEGDTIVDSKFCICKFNGSKYRHYVLPYEGTRYSLVFFKNFKNLVLK